jgi:hypothetical protein
MVMPVTIASFESLSEEEFNALRQQKVRQTNPAMAQLLDAIELGTPVRVPLVEGQSARGLRVAIARAASSRGLAVETLEGDSFVAARKLDGSPSKKPSQQLAELGKRRGRPRKRQEPSQEE